MWLLFRHGALQTSIENGRNKCKHKQKKKINNTTITHENFSFILHFWHVRYHGRTVLWQLDVASTAFRQLSIYRAGR